MTTFIGIIAPSPARALAERPHTHHAARDGGGDDDDRGGVRSHDGNGTRNRNIFSVKSPSINRGYQHTSASTAGGATTVQNALCRHAKVCNITLQVIVIAPKKAKKPASKKAREQDTTDADESGDDDRCCCEDD
ncbi:hypothetical protein AB0O34_22490 [Sphaerisporangium sp. NPDC088356]|uniref:hypothetical protein n=1 Tax=Sphaerisporangium sp. NPDC088356 TaxID=3154871 RepID=UPI0034164F1E